MESKVRFVNTNLIRISEYALQQQITNPDNWKKTREKQFEAWMAYSWSSIRFEVKQKNGDILQYDIGDMGSYIHKVAICTYFRTIFNIDITEAAREYIFETGEAVSAASIERKRYDISLDWTKVKKIPNSGIYAACFIPKKSNWIRNG